MTFTDDFMCERYQIDAPTRVDGQNRRRVAHCGGALPQTDLEKIAAIAVISAQISAFPTVRGSRRLTLGDVRVCDNGDETAVTPLTKAATNRFRAYPGLVAVRQSRALPFGRSRDLFWDQYDQGSDVRGANIEAGTSTECPSFLGGYHVA